MRADKHFCLMSIAGFTGVAGWHACVERNEVRGCLQEMKWGGGVHQQVRILLGVGDGRLGSGGVAFQVAGGEAVDDGEVVGRGPRQEPVPFVQQRLWWESVLDGDENRTSFRRRISCLCLGDVSSGCQIALVPWSGFPGRTSRKFHFRFLGSGSSQCQLPTANCRSRGSTNFGWPARLRLEGRPIH